MVPRLYEFKRTTRLTNRLSSFTVKIARYKRKLFSVSVLAFRTRFCFLDYLPATIFKNVNTAIANSLPESSLLSSQSLSHPVTLCVLVGLSPEGKKNKNIEKLEIPFSFKIQHSNPGCRC